MWGLPCIVWEIGRPLGHSQKSFLRSVLCWRLVIDDGSELSWSPSPSSPDNTAWVELSDF